MLETFANAVFPEYPYRMLTKFDLLSFENTSTTESTQTSNFKSNSNFILLATYSGPDCAGIQVSKRESVLPRVFPGPILYLNGESEPSYSTQSPFHPEIYSIGHEADNATQHRLRVYHGAITLLRFSQPFLNESLFSRKSKAEKWRPHFLLYLASHCVPFRDEAFWKLSAIAEAHVGGKCPIKWQASSNARRPQLPNRSFFPANYELFRDYRFALVMENKQHPGYITEKIFNAFIGGAIPIWYGTTEIFNIFNSEAFVFYDIHDPEKSLKLVRYLEQNLTAQQEMREKPILRNGFETLQTYFSLRDDVGGGVLKGRIRSMMSL